MARLAKNRVQDERRNFESLMTGAPVKEDLVADGWTEAFRLLFGSLREKALKGATGTLGAHLTLVAEALSGWPEKVSHR